MSKKKYLLGSVLFLLLLLTLHFVGFRNYYNSVLSDFDIDFFEPALNLSWGYILTSIILLFSSENIFHKWFRKIFLWFLPVSLIIVFITDVYGGMLQPSRTDMAWYSSFLLVLTTIIFILLYRNYFKVK